MCVLGIADQRINWMGIIAFNLCTRGNWTLRNVLVKVLILKTARFDFVIKGRLTLCDLSLVCYTNCKLERFT